MAKLLRPIPTEEVRAWLLPARAQPQSRHLALGNPSWAVADPTQPTNYLISRDQDALSYHRDRGIPNWVSWHLEAADLGAIRATRVPLSPIPRCLQAGTRCGTTTKPARALTAAT